MHNNYLQLFFCLPPWRYSLRFKTSGLMQMLLTPVARTMPIVICLDPDSTVKLSPFQIRSGTVILLIWDGRHSCLSSLLLESICGCFVALSALPMNNTLKNSLTVLKVRVSNFAVLEEYVVN